jgi:hypothetical protein
MSKCDVEWCESEASLVWVRTAKELKSMKGRKIKGSAAEAAPSRQVCSTHCPSWRRAAYVEIPR